MPKYKIIFAILISFAIRSQLHSSIDYRLIFMLSSLISNVTYNIIEITHGFHKGENLTYLIRKNFNIKTVSLRLLYSTAF